MNTAERGLLGGCIAAFVVGAAGAVSLMLAAWRHYAPFDSAALVFVHYRLPHAALDGRLFTGALALWFAGFIGILAWLAGRRGAPAWRFLASVCGAQLVLSLAFALLPIAIDSDQYAYAGYAYAQRQGNPYHPTAIGADAPRAQAQIARHWGNPLVPDRYGPAWTLFNAALLRPFLGAPLVVQTAVLRAAAIIAALLTTLLLALTFRGALAYAATAAFALNPLVIVETANGAHNDVYAVLFGMLAVFFAWRSRFGWAGLALGAAAAVKFAYLPLILPLAAYALTFRRRAVDAAAAVAGCLAVLFLTASAYGVKTALWVTPAASAVRPTGALALLAHLLRHVPFAATHAMQITSVAVVAAFTAAVVLFAMDVFVGRRADAAIVATAVLLLMLPGKIEPWYGLLAAPLLLAGRNGICTFVAISAGCAALTFASFSGSLPLIPAVVAAALAYAATASLIRPRLRGRAAFA